MIFLQNSGVSRARNTMVIRNLGWTMMISGPRQPPETPGVPAAEIYFYIIELKACFSQLPGLHFLSEIHSINHNAAPKVIPKVPKLHYAPAMNILSNFLSSHESNDNRMEILQRWCMKIETYRLQPSGPGDLENGQRYCEEIAEAFKHTVELLVQDIRHEDTRPEHEDSTESVLDMFMRKDVLRTVVRGFVQSRIQTPQDEIALLSVIDQSTRLVASDPNQGILLHQNIHQPLVELLELCAGHGVAKSASVKGNDKSSGNTAKASSERMEHVVVSKSAIKLHSSVLLKLIYQISEGVVRNPQLLPIFCNPSQEMPIINILLPFLHSEDGRNTESCHYARSAILNLLSVVSPSKHPDIESFILEQTALVQVLVSHMGSLWASQLPINSMTSTSNSAQDINSDDSAITKVIDNIQYCNEILRTCPSKRISDKLSSLFITDFLGRIVTTSIMESVDFDGTALSILCYLRQLVLQMTPKAPLTLALINTLLGGEQQPSEDMELTVKDILLCRLNSMVDNVVIMTLELFEALLRKHPGITHLRLVSKLENNHTRKMSMSDTTAKECLMMFQRLLESLNSITGTAFTHEAAHETNDLRIHSSQDHNIALAQLSESRDLRFYITDALHNLEAQLESHETVQPVSEVKSSPMLELLQPFESKSSVSLTSNEEDSPVTEQFMFIRSPVMEVAPLSTHAEPSTVNQYSTESPKEQSQHDQQILQLNRDPFLSKLLRKLTLFFHQSFELNLALTGVWTSLASFPDALLYEWMFCSVSETSHLDMASCDDDKKESSISTLNSNTESTHYTTFLAVLQSLIDKVHEMNDSSPEFTDKLKATRTKMFDEWEQQMGITQDKPKRTKTGFWGLVTSFAASLDTDSDDSEEDNNMSTDTDPLTNATSRNTLKNVVLLEEFIKEIIGVAYVLRYHLDWPLECLDEGVD